MKKLFLSFFLLFSSVAEAQVYRGFQLNPFRVQALREDVEQTAALGANIYRYYIGYPLPHDVYNWDPGVYDGFLNAHISTIDYVMPTIAAKGAKLVIDLHTPPCGINPQGVNEIFVNTTCLQQFYQAWSTIANHYKNNPNVVAYDVLNEPQTQNYPYWNAVYQAAASVIRGIDPNRTLIHGPIYGAAQYVKYMIPNLPNTWYTAHLYCIGNSSGTSKLLDPVLSFRKKHAAQFYIGEIGCPVSYSKADDFLENMFKKLKQYNIPWTYHAWQEDPMWNPLGTPSMGVLTKYLNQGNSGGGGCSCVCP